MACLIVALSVAAEPLVRIVSNAPSVPSKAEEDTIAKPRYGVKKTAVQDMEQHTHSADLKDPENIKTEIEYEEKTGTYRYGTKIGETWLDAPFFLTGEEYARWQSERTIKQYYRKKNAEEYKAKGKDKFDFSDMQFNLGPLEKIFGPGGVRITTNGSAELKIGVNMRNVDNPSLSEENRKVFGFDFDETINLNLNGKVGDKVNMDFNYNSNATFTFDAQSLKLHYEGKEDEIIKLVEAGNVSLPTNSSLIRGASALFGIRTDLQFGKLKLQTVVSQKKSSTTSVNSKGGVQLTDFEIAVTDYDENRHFFLAHYFRDHYDQSMSQLPNIMSGIKINRIEVWVTNKSGATQNIRDIVAFTDIAESSVYNHNLWIGSTQQHPQNNSNSLYAEISNIANTSRDITRISALLDAQMLVGGKDYEKLENAKLLSANEYELNEALGYLSLRSALQPDQVLAVAFEYTYNGKIYQVGEFSTDIRETDKALFVKTLKNTANTPQMLNWDLMMKNVYSLGATSIQKDKFRFDIKYLSDTTGVYLSYLPEPGLKDKRLLQLLGLDRLDNNNRPNPNAYFDFVDGYTVDAASGRIFFPVVEPFGEHLHRVIGDAITADRYAYPEIYDSTKTVAKQTAEKDKFIITGQYKASKTNEISLGTMYVPEGSVVVTAGGMTLTEGVDYTVDYTSGIVRILNQSILDAGTSINVSLESNSNYGMLRKTMFGVNFQYDFSQDFQFGGSLMHLGEKPLTTKVAMGSEPLNNTIWGLNFAWKKQSQWLTNMLDKLPILSCSAPSSIQLSGDFAQLIAGKNSDSQGNASYIDDFENTESDIDVSNPKEWVLSSVPSMFPESKLTNDIKAGYNRALLAWYYIDPLFTRRSSSLTPGHIKGDLEQLSDHDVREVYQSELFPNKSINYKESTTLNVLNLAFYPNERGPYNLDPNLDYDGRLSAPQTRWGGMMRRIDNSDFEAANIEYIEFWLMDPFIKAREEGKTISGDLYFNLGEVSEDILKDGMKFGESSMPTDGSQTYTETNWGRVSTTNNTVYAFNASSGTRHLQDLGYNGLTSEEERNHPSYAQYLQQIKTRVSPEVYDSIYNAPSGDKYHYFRGSDFDASHVSIKDRYRRINNPNGNSVATDQSPESYSTTYKTTPDVEDINQDYTLNEYEKYYQYRVKIDPTQMEVGFNHIVDKRVASVKTRNGVTQDVTWYQFRIPLNDYEKREGNISDFSSIRFMRMFMTGFEAPIVLRFGTLHLVRGDWRVYEKSLYNGEAPSTSGTLHVSAVNYEENNERTPVNYVLPPGISRVIDPGQEQVLQNNEQSLNLTVENLASGEARAVYKHTTLDLRRYKHLQMFVHANALKNDIQLKDGDMSLFIRLGSDYKNNFYEYEIPLTLTPEGQYSSSAQGRQTVWPIENMLDIDLSLFTDTKRNRNRQKALGLASFAEVYEEYDATHPNNKISVMGNPTLGEVRTVMIGIRNNSRQTGGVEVWANELRLQEYSNEGGWAARGLMNLQLSDVATINAMGHIETVGFGGLEETVAQRRDDDFYEYSVTANVQLGRFVPEKVKLSAPLYYSYSKQVTTPKYNPLDTDMTMDDALAGCASAHERDSISNIAERVTENRNFSVSGVRFNIATKKQPMPYDPANFTFSYAYSSRNNTGETTIWEKDQQWKFNLGYSYSPNLKTYEPFKKAIKSKSPWLKFVKDLGFNLLPQNVSFNADITRNYYEMQERDMENLENHSLPLTWSSDFFYNRNFSLRWDLTRNLQMTFSSGTNAEVEQPYTPVNKALYPDAYEAWKDSVWTSIQHMGTPLTYQQQFNLSWKLPINKIPIFDWVTTNATYNATYNWNRGAEFEDGTTLGNTIANSRNFNLTGNFNLETLYNHSKFLKKVNKKFTASSKKQNNAKNTNDGKKTFLKEITLKADTSLVVEHKQKTKKIKVAAIRPDGSKYQVRYKVLDNNKIEILTRDTARIKLSVVPKAPLENQLWYKIAERSTRVLMMVRRINVSYKNTYSLQLPGFLPRVGDMFGQRSNGGLTPGLDFAFGLVDDGYVAKAAEKGWLHRSDSVVTPAASSLTEDFQMKITLEPWPTVKIDLNASRNRNRSHSIQYMFSGMPTTESGSFSMTTVSIGSAFEGVGSASNGYRSATFTKFVNLLDSYRDRVEAKYAGSIYPEGTSLAGETFNPANGTVSKYAAEVMIPAFLEAYTGNKDSDIFPSFASIFPNWNFTYSGLIKLPAMQNIFKSFNINHSYKSVYNVGSYNSFSSYHEYMNGIGFITDVSTGNPTPSCPFDISAVSINESFSPLIGVDMAFHNGLTAKVEYRKTRVLTLSMTSQQLNETHSNDFIIGVGYKIADFKMFKPKGKVRRVKAKQTTRDEAGNTKTSGSKTNASGFSQDLNLRLDVSLRDQAAIGRDILTQRSEATSGNKAVQIKFSADYAFSKFVTLTAYYDRQFNEPLLTSSSYPTTTQDFGVTVKFKLTR